MRPFLLVLLIALQVAVPMLCGAAPLALAHGTERPAAATLSHSHAGHTGEAHTGPGHAHGECPAEWVGLVSPLALRSALPQQTFAGTDADRVPAPAYEVPAPVPIRG